MGSSNSDDDDCDAGSEGCPCRTDSSCDSGLSCASNTCVFIAGTGATAGSSSDAGATGDPSGGTSTGGTRNASVPGGIKPTPQNSGGTSSGSGGTGGTDQVPTCPVCEGETPICDLVTLACKTCTALEGCSGDTVCDERANGDLGACVPLTIGEGGAGGQGSVEPPPTAWTCVPTYYGDGECDCGCGAVDIDCADSQATSCVYCIGCSHVSGQLTAPNCPGAIVADENWRCEGWTCEPEWYGDMACDCGCGVVDVDCTDSLVGTCQFCLGCNSHPQLMCPGTIDPQDNSTCAP